MRRAAIVLLLLIVACRKETPSPGPSGHPLPPGEGRRARSERQGEGRKQRPTTSTPRACAGDGSYDAAVECFRIASHLAFTITDVRSFKAVGEMTRPTPGAEVVHFKANNGEWKAETHPGGLLWTHDGKRASGPDYADRIYQRTTLYLDPAKREAWAQRLDDDTPVNGVLCNHYHFTDANSGDPHDIWVSRETGDIVRMRIGSWMMDVSR